MHFAQTLDAGIIPEWKSRYVNFAQGKKVIAKIERTLPEKELPQRPEGAWDLPPPAMPLSGETNNIGRTAEHPTIPNLPNSNAFSTDTPATEPEPESESNELNSSNYCRNNRQATRPWRSETAPHTPRFHIPERTGSSTNLNSSRNSSRLTSPALWSSRLFQTPQSPADQSGIPLDNISVSAEGANSQVFFTWLNGEVVRANAFYFTMAAEHREKLTLLEWQFAHFELHRAVHHRERAQHMGPHAARRATSFLEHIDMPSLPMIVRMALYGDQQIKHNAPPDVDPTLPEFASPAAASGRTSVAPLPTPLQRAHTQRLKAHTADFSNSGDRVGYYQAKQMLRTALADFYSSLNQLRGFRQLNMTAIRKIVKKYDKLVLDRLGLPHTTEKYMREIARLPLASGIPGSVEAEDVDRQNNCDYERRGYNRENGDFESQNSTGDRTDYGSRHELSVDKMIEKTESMYAEHFTQGNHKRAVDSLRVAMLGEDEHHPMALFISGLASGAAVPMGIIAIWAALHFRSRRDEGDGMLPMGSLSSVGNINNMKVGTTDESSLTLTSALVHVMSSALSELRMTGETTYLLQILGGFTLLSVCFMGFTACLWIWSACRINYSFIIEFDKATMLTPPQFGAVSAMYTLLLALMAFLTFITVQSFHRYYPCLLLGISVAALIVPGGPVRPARQWLLHSLWRLMLSGFYPVEFRDLLFGDIMCSLNYSLSNLEIFFCVYAATPRWWTPGGALHAQRCTSSHSRSLGFLNCLPGIWRFLQCWRRYGDTLDWFPHLLNSAKYAFNILYNMSLSLARISPTSTGLRVLFIVMAAINGVFSALWDIFMDFSLTPRLSKKLRVNLVYPWWTYWAVMIIDPIMRQAWVLYAVIWHDKQQSALISFVVALIEIVRRMIWVAFRVENEHAANISRCRAFKDLYLPYDNVAPIEEDMNDSSDAQSHSSVKRTLTFLTRRHTETTV